jgi:hypothetical protein
MWSKNGENAGGAFPPPLLLELAADAPGFPATVLNILPVEQSLYAKQQNNEAYELRDT